MKTTIKDDCTHAYVVIVVPVALFMVPFTAVMQGQELPQCATGSRQAPNSALAQAEAAAGEARQPGPWKR